MKPVKATVLMATYNGQEFVEEQIESINSQVGVQVEILFSDDGSNDNTQSILKKYKNCTDLSHHHKNSGSAQNFLYLLQAAGSKNLSDYIFLSDQDDIWLPNKMQRAVSVLEKGYDCYSGSFFRYHSRINKKSLTYVNKKFDNFPLNGIYRSPGPGFTYAFKREAFEKIINSDALKLFYPHTQCRVRWHDWLIFSVALHLELHWFIDDQAHALYRVHGRNDTGQLTSIKQLLYRSKFVASGSYFREVLELTKFRNDQYSILVRTTGLKAIILVILHILKVRRSLIERLGILMSFIMYKLMISQR